MNKIISTLTLSAFLGISGLSANGVGSKVESTFTQADSNFLFGENAKNLNVQVLSQEELKETKGEFWPAIFWGMGTGFAWGSGQSIATDWWNKQPINWDNAINNGLWGAAGGAVFGGLGSKLGIR
ncbi:hypothetical protein [Helicobacter sp. T3_23-1056]